MSDSFSITDPAQTAAQEWRARELALTGAQEVCALAKFAEAEADIEAARGRAAYWRDKLARIRRYAADLRSAPPEAA